MDHVYKDRTIYRSPQQFDLNPREHISACKSKGKPLHKMASLQFAFVCLVAICWINGGVSIPLADKEFFWYPTDTGTVVPAILKGQPNSIAESKRAVEDDVVFWHYLIGESNGRVISPNCNGCLAGLIKDAPTVFLAHGFSSSHTGGFGTRLREGFAKRNQNVNMVFVNWSELSGAPWYESAANSVKPVGEYIAKMINYLIEQKITSAENIHFIGHSLGAHMANYISANFSAGKLRHVVALDPALPLFGEKDDDERIDPTDGHFVTVLHTSMGTLLDGGLSFTEPRGHVDFYPNSGKHQPGCSRIDFGACSHSRAYHFLGESIANPQAFPSCKCDSWEEYDSGECACNTQTFMGYDTPQSSVEGSYYLKTNADSPYGQGQA